MKNLARTLSLFAVLTLVGSTSSSALGSYRPGDCVYECSNPTTGATVQSAIQASPFACCSGTAPFGCPLGWTYLDTLYWVNSTGPQVCNY